MLVLAAASVRSDDLHLDVMQDELLGGEYYPNNSNSSWYIKLSAKVEGGCLKCCSTCCKDICTLHSSLLMHAQPKS